MKPYLCIIPALALALASCGSDGAGSGRPQSEQSVITSQCSALATTSCGRVAGYIDRGVYTYKGIPYAKARRFMAPEAPDAWEGVRSSRAYGPVSPQAERQGWQSDEQAYAFNWNDGHQSEDCLRLNIWTPSLQCCDRPVMVWLHGGGYAAGSGHELPSYDGRNLAQSQDVVVVSVNHRLNVLGFLDLSAFGERYANSGNAGMLDIVAALRWVRDNIANFGGNPRNVTVFGQSGGGGKVSTLLSMPDAGGLFHKAIIQSGSMMRTMTSAHSRRIGAETAANLGLDARTIAAIDTIPYGELLAAGEKAVAKVRSEAEREGINSFMFGWAPTVDGRILPCQPFDRAAPAQSRNIPVMIGTTQHEFTASTYIPGLAERSAEEILAMVRARYGSRSDEFLSAFGRAYQAYKPLDLLDCDFIFRPNAVEQAGLIARDAAAPVYMYLFAWESPVMDGKFRSTHCMEIPFVFANTDLHESMTGGGADAARLADAMSHAWAQFARTGNPSVPELPDWEPYTTEGGATMLLADEPRMLHHHDRDLLEVVRSFPIRGL